MYELLLLIPFAVLVWKQGDFDPVFILLCLGILICVTIGLAFIVER